MFSVGVSLGHDATLVERIRSLDRRMALLPLCTIVGTLAGAALVSPLLHTVPPADAMAVGAGFGYYSLSSIFISELRSVELGTVALLCNVLRELFTLLAAPWVSGRWPRFRRAAPRPSTPPSRSSPASQDRSMPS